MDYNLIKKLVKVIEQSEVTELSVQEGDLKIKISKNGKQQVVNTVVSQPMSAQQMYAPQPTQEVGGSAETVDDNSNPKLHEVLSPIVGTFYRSPSPKADSYVQVGDNVSEGSVMCIVEAMKLMNEIEADAGGKIVKILVENATAVEYNQPLFLIEKS
ncbi:MAG: acetyl-CoA carboxylase biotin carboxyl carrier protein [Melioribacteraceae bacterium]|jgi:acetyl-CoA carboxylase biotin carboxyl carrier protein|nr:acetyl-CoA carboxylase biotin carboxyl carrier protein [Melioribacteraceae bacterium]